MRATRLEAPLSTDGRLDEPIYGVVPPADDFVQQEPLEGEPATEKTEAWIFFDDRNIYVSVRAWDSQPERMVANELRRDGQRINQGANIALVFDTFHDRRNGFYFQTNPLGALRDQEVTDEGNSNPDWNTVWDVQTARFRARLDVRDGHSFPVPALSRTGPSGVGLQHAPCRGLEE